MTKTIVGTHVETNPRWQAWSQAVAHAESLPVGTGAERAAWDIVDIAWQDYRMSLEVQKVEKLYQVAKLALAPLVGELVASVKPMVGEHAPDEDDYFGAMRP